ncbi:hypothetical protein FH584_17975 [Leptospira interrogans]|uniref:hypothetical protein n=1 Tax=Leptospira interrogans TaxID=173 RepID=UPI00122CB9B0|nr:hypothetical protein [Leptospira interrogans]KAA1289097.1 hypothetical protein C4X99_21225 [Leptospira interrogans serovar Geyaweera]KAA1289396.1 hypothetical protein C4X99_19915 [Leptospira interrogans serovar Geyaweera]KAA1293075.1 hypothetical protein C4X99_03300 [Leptospira interrogans serovar Geyaweera]KAA1293843.1 hypothetical protein C4X99_01890 [Leptospira interrogans serovar Geyaweera]ULG94374.1 hypothetical protein FH584_17975 [Leptospira interrogans]
MKTVERIAFLRQAIYKKYSDEVLRELGNESDSTDRWKRLADKAISRSAVFQTYIECRDNIADFAEWQNEELTEEKIQQEKK